MRIIVNGQQAFGRSVLEGLLERGEDVVGVFTAPDSDSGAQDPLKECAVENDLPVFQPKSFRRDSVKDQVGELKPDLCVMAYVTLFVPEAVLNVPTHGTIQYHPSLLPMHKGPSSINWPIIFGEKKTGLSIFWPDDGLDTGPILLQKEVAIEPDDTLGSVYFNHLYPLGVDAMMESVDLVRDGDAPRIEQDPDAGSYEGWCREEQAEIDWTKPVDEVYNLIRGCNPQPGAWTHLNGERLQIFDSRRGSADEAQPGEVVGVHDDSLEVAASGGSIEILRVRPAGEAKIHVPEFIEAAGIKKGDVLGN
ncbi:MAG: methionyl-tRNA formyltransferase [Gammaproteobacteria bacterium]|nr:methionyl-tRNA formyltransferase [Gammaproteobacteria bacterium]